MTSMQVEVYFWMKQKQTSKQKIFKLGLVKKTIPRCSHFHASCRVAVKRTLDFQLLLILCQDNTINTTFCYLPNIFLTLRGRRRGTEGWGRGGGRVGVVWCFGSRNFSNMEMELNMSLWVLMSLFRNQLTWKSY